MLRSRLRTGCLSLPPHSRAQSQSQVQPSSKGWRQRLHLPVEETAESHAKGMDSGSKKGVGTFICISPSYPNGWCIYPSPVLISGISDLYCGFHGKAHNKPTCRHEDNPLKEKCLLHPSFENRMWSVYTEAHKDTNTFGISLVVQWLRIRLAMRGMPVWSLVQELGSHRLWRSWAHVHHNCEAHGLQSHVLQSPHATTRVRALQWRSRVMQWRSCMPQLRPNTIQTNKQMSFKDKHTC